ncbi:MAG: NAD-dependent epimerase/dehydratase family protein [Phycisphaerales bacterium]
MNTTHALHHTLVTGGAGFIGSHLIERLLEDPGCAVTVVDNLSTGRRSNLDHAMHIAHGRLHFIEGDVADVVPELDARTFSSIYHLAAAVGVQLVISQPIHTITTNVLDTLTVLDFAKRARVPTLIASTSEVYGKSTATPFAEDDDVVYGPTIYSRWSYACSKAIDEYLALAYTREHELPTVIVRFFNTIGPRQVGRYGMVVPRFVKAALNGKPLEVHGDGEQSRCFCDVRDVVAVLPELLQNTECHGRVFNLGRDEPISIVELAKLICTTLDRKGDIRLVPYADALGEGFDDLRHRQPDLTRLRSVINFQPAISLHQTIRDIAADMQHDAPTPPHAARVETST